MSKPIIYERVWESIKSPEEAIEKFGAAGTLIINERNEVLLGLHRDAGYELWGNAAGGREAGETPEATALRETEEEFGLNFTDDDLIKRLILVRFDGDDDNEELGGLKIGVVFLIRVNSNKLDLTKHDSSGEISTLKFFPKEEILELTDCFQIADHLWGGGWTEMALRIFYELGPRKFHSMYCFEGDPNGRWKEPYRRIKDEEKQITG